MLASELPSYCLPWNTSLLALDDIALEYSALEPIPLELKPVAWNLTLFSQDNLELHLDSTFETGHVNCGQPQFTMHVISDRFLPNNAIDLVDKALSLPLA